MRVLVQQFYAKLLLQHYYYWAIHDVAVLYLSVSQTVRTNTPKSGNELLGGVGAVELTDLHPTNGN